MRPLSAIVVESGFVMPSEQEVLDAIAGGVTTTKELTERFPSLSHAHAAVLLSRYLQRGVVIRHKERTDGKGRPRFIYRLSKNGHDRVKNEEIAREIAELKARIRELEEKLGE